MSATNKVIPFRGVPLVNVAEAAITVTATAQAYATANGGLAIDLTDVLRQISPFEAPINPVDIVGVSPKGASTSGYIAIDITIGTPTYTTLPGGSASRPNQVLATCPAFLRLIGGSTFAQPADGNVTDTVSFFLKIRRDGSNLN
jgi:hypothetical protein